MKDVISLSKSLASISRLCLNRTPGKYVILQRPEVNTSDYIL